MSKPRIFISSTYYDMRTVRADLERFIKEQGYEPVLFERGHIPYGVEDKLEDDCYREITTCDILVNIIGGKFGTESKDVQYSISQNELKKAIELGKQIYIFVERTVLAEYATYKVNKAVKGFIPASVNDVRVFSFLEEVFSLFGRNPVQAFETSQDIILFLKEQWAGLFQRLIQETGMYKEFERFEQLSLMLSTVQQLVTFLTTEKTKDRDAIIEIITANHPIFLHLRSLLNVPYKFSFTTIDEFKTWIKQRSFDEVTTEEWDDPGVMEWISRGERQPKKLLKVNLNIFDDTGKLRSADYWTADSVKLSEMNPDIGITDKDIPF